jgi:hypothetical protein
MTLARTRAAIARSVFARWICSSISIHRAAQGRVVTKRGPTSLLNGPGSPNSSWTSPPPFGLLAAVGFFVHGRPRPALGLVVRDTATFIAILDVFGLTFLFVGIARLISAWHVLDLSRLGMFRSRSDWQTSAEHLPLFAADLDHAHRGQCRFAAVCAQAECFDASRFSASER